MEYPCVLCSQKGTKAPQAAGKIHTDFEKGFIMADVMKYSDFKEEGSEAACKVSIVAGNPIHYMHFKDSSVFFSPRFREIEFDIRGCWEVQAARAKLCRRGWRHNFLQIQCRSRLERCKEEMMSGPAVGVACPFVPEPHSVHLLCWLLRS
ncbi:hypothetical protein PR048_026021, partial [Dryococelus australis]